MKILMMTNTYAPIVGGLEKSVQVFSEQFRKRGHQVKIVAPEFKKAAKDEKDIIRVPALEKFVGTDFSVALPLPEVIKDMLKDYHPDIVHSHHPFLVGDLALRLCGERKIPLVFTYHTMFEHYTDHFGMSTSVMQKFVIEMATGYANMADHVIVPSESVGKILLERNVTTPVSVVPTGVDIGRFSIPPDPNFRRKYKLPERAFVVGHIGRLAPEKNLIFLTEAVAEFLKNKKDAWFFVAGSGPAEREMRKIFRAWKVSKRVCFAGILKGNALVNAYQAMDVFAFASKSETQGMVTTEAMAAGLPVVGLDATGTREVVKDRVNGRLIMEESRTQFAAALDWCATRNAVQKKKLKQEALNTAHEFSMELSADKALKIYQNVKIKEKRAQEPGDWQKLTGRFKTEFDLLLNFGKAAGSALVKMAIPDRDIKDKVSELYQHEIAEARKNWTAMVIQLRKELSSAGPENKEKIEMTIKDIAQKIHENEMELAELQRKVVNSCEALEKFLQENNQKIKTEAENATHDPATGAFLSDRKQEHAESLPTLLEKNV